MLDTADEARRARWRRRCASASPGESLTEAVVRAIKQDTARFEEAPTS